MANAAAFDQMFEQVMEGEPHMITKDGAPVAVIIRHDYYEWLCAQLMEELSESEIEAIASEASAQSSGDAQGQDDPRQEEAG